MKPSHSEACSRRHTVTERTPEKSQVELSIASMQATVILSKKFNRGPSVGLHQ